jgi:NlpC/P60 family
MRRHTWSLSAFFLATGLALSVSLVVPSGDSRARESVSRGSTAEETALLQEENSAVYSQYAESSPPGSFRDAPRVSPTGDGLPRTTVKGKAIDSDNSNFVSQGSIADGPTLREEHFPPYSQVVDNSSPRRFRAPGWDITSSNPDGYRRNYRVARPSERAKPAKFKVEIPATDVYSVYAWWPAGRHNNAAARFGISTTSKVRWIKVNQRRDGGLWVKLGEYRMEAGDHYTVRVSPTSQKGGYVVADAVAVVRGVLSAPPKESHGKAARGDATYTSSATEIRGQRIVNVARNHIGTYYRHSPPFPCQAFSSEDCSCHTKLVFAELNIQLPDRPTGQWRYGRGVAKATLRPGDLVFFKESGPSNPITHVGIYSGQGNVIHASSHFGRVVESRMRYIKGYFGAKRL